MKTFIKISKQGEVKTFAGDFPLLEQRLKRKSVVRVSRVVPHNLLLRLAFCLIRSVVRDSNPLVSTTVMSWPH